MPDTDRNPTPQRREKKKDSLVPAFIISSILFLLVIGGIGLFFFNGQEETNEPASSKEIPATSPGQTATKDDVISDVRPTQPVNIDELLPDMGDIEGKHLEEPGVPGPAVTDEADNLEKECKLLADKLDIFFNHIDAEEYMAPFALQMPAQTYFTDLAYKLLDNPPVVSRESDDLYTILKNMAHFFRVIGGNNILLMKTILDRERDKIEDVASEMYQWTTIGTCRSDRFSFAAPLEKTYEYAGFFLNTMGGRSYLFRRDSRSRLLVNYYSILIVTTADKRGINRHGIDISLLIPQLIQEIESTTQLIYKENYLDQLYDLMEKYQ